MPAVNVSSLLKKHRRLETCSKKMRKYSINVNPSYFGNVARIGLLVTCIFAFTLLFFRVSDSGPDLASSQGPTIYVVTPTLKRPLQKAQLTHMAQLFATIPNIFWIIVEDDTLTNPMINRLLARTKLDRRSIHFAFHEDKAIARKGLPQRNEGLRWLREHLRGSKHHSLVYFADDDFIYSADLFAEIGKIQPGMVGVWPVAYVGGVKVETPVLQDGRVVAFNSRRSRQPDRKFAMDIAGFAVSSSLLLKRPDVKFEPQASVGYEESYFLEGIIEGYDDLQPLAFDCTEVMVWHAPAANLSLELELDHPSDLAIEV